MNSINQTLNKPGASSGRIYGLDVARAFAVFGMVLINFKVVMWDWVTGSQLLKSAVEFFEGKAAATFVLLAGIGISILAARTKTGSSDEQRLKSKREMGGDLLKRSLFLLVAGLLYTPFWPADILHFYALYIGIAVLLLRVNSKTLLWLIPLPILLFIGLYTIIPYENGWNFFTLEYKDMWTPAGFIRHMFYNGFHPVLPWISFVLLGMWIGRRDLSDRKRVKKMFVISSLVFILTELISKLSHHWLPESIAKIKTVTDTSLLSTSPMPPLPLYLVSGASFAIASISLCILLVDRSKSKGFWEPFIFTGQLAFTLYIAHVVIGMGIAEELGFLNNNSLTFVIKYALAFNIISVIAAYFIRKRFKRGPIEALMRKITKT